MVLNSINNVREIGESTLPNALPWKAIAPVPYYQKGMVREHLDKLKELSDKRVSNHKFFKKVDENIEEYLTKIKSRKYTTLFKIKEDFQKRKEEETTKNKDSVAKKKTKEVKKNEYEEECLNKVNLI